MSVRLRFAPSPTGPLHIGGARTALFNLLIAKRQGGSFVLRIDDTDRERSEKRYEEDILQGLQWLGVSWDEGPEKGGSFGPYRQSERVDFHRAAADQLLAKNAAYRDADGAVRLRYTVGEVVIEDLVCGRCVFPLPSLGPEPVLVRADGTPTYHLATVSDDIEMQISHVVRGQDHLTNSAKHQLLFHALGASEPQFAHVPLILGADGAKLSKRDPRAQVRVADFRAQGIVAEALANFLLLLGWSHPEGLERFSIDEAAASFDIGRVSTTAATFERSKLNWLNGWWVRHLTPDVLAKRSWEFLGEYAAAVEARGIPFWREALAAMQSELTTLTDVRNVAAWLFALDVTPSEPTLAEIKSAAGADIVLKLWRQLLGETETENLDCYSSEQVSRMISFLRKNAPLPAKQVFYALRFGVTGSTSGPELKILLPLIPREALLSRAESAIELLTS